MVLSSQNSTPIIKDEYDPDPFNRQSQHADRNSSVTLSTA